MLLYTVNSTSLSKLIKPPINCFKLFTFNAFSFFHHTPSNHLGFVQIGSFTLSLAICFSLIHTSNKLLTSSIMLYLCFINTAKSFKHVNSDRNLNFKHNINNVSFVYQDLPYFLLLVISMFSFGVDNNVKNHYHS